MSGIASVRKVESPNPNWKPGQKVSHPFPDSEMIDLDPSQLGASGMYPFIISSCVPRPIAFICSLSSQGVINLSPYSYFNFMSQDPPVLCIGTCSSAPTAERPSFMKDSQQNIVDTEEFTVNMISEWFVEAANHTCGNYDPDVDELALAGFTAVPSTSVKPPRLQESVVQFECRLRDTHEITNKEGKVTSTIIIAEVVLAHVNKHVSTTTKNGHVIVDLMKYAPVSRCGGDTYARITEAYDLPRPGKEWQNRGREQSNS